MDHFRSPRNVGVVELPDLVGVGKIGGAGPTVELHLRMCQGRILDARFKAFGCGATIAAASMLTEIIKNRLLADCLAITPPELAQALGGLPPEKMHCATIAIGALRSAAPPG